MGILDPTVPSDYDSREIHALAPRVDDVSEKRIGLYDNGKMAAEPVLAVLREKLEDRYPEATISTHAKEAKHVVQDPDELEAVREWAAEEIDVCVGAIGDCGSCTKFLTWGLQAVEEAGVPSVGLVDEGFVLDWQSNAVERGYPLRYVDSAVRSEVRDRDLIAERLTPAVLDEIVGELTRPLTETERGMAPRRETTARREDEA